MYHDMDTPFQAHVIEHSPVLWGRDAWPNLIEFLLFFLFSLFVTSDCILEFLRKTKKANYSKRFFLIIFSTYLILHSVLIAVPFPFEEFSLHFLSEELPVFLLFVSWGVLAIWLGSALILQNNESRMMKNIVIFVFVGIFSLLFIYTLVTQILIHGVHLFKLKSDDQLFFFSLAAHIVGLIIIFPINIFYFFKLRKLYKDNNIIQNIKERIKILYILLFFLFMVFLLRFLIELLTLVLFEIGTDILKNNLYMPCENEEKCLRVNLYSFLAAAACELLPSIFLYSTFLVLNRPLAKPKKTSAPLTAPLLHPSHPRGGAAGGEGGYDTYGQSGWHNIQERDGMGGDGYANVNMNAGVTGFGVSGYQGLGVRGGGVDLDSDIPFEPSPSLSTSTPQLYQTRGFASSLSSMLQGGGINAGSGGSAYVYTQHGYPTYSDPSYYFDG